MMLTLMCAFFFFIMPIILSFVFSYHCVWSLLQHLVEHRGRMLDWGVDSSLQVVVLRRWTGRRELGRVISEFKLLLQTVESPALKRHEKLSQPCYGIFFQASGCKMSSYVPVFSEGAVGTAGPLGGMLLHSHLCSFGGSAFGNAVCLQTFLSMGKLHFSMVCYLSWRVRACRLEENIKKVLCLFPGLSIWCRCVTVRWPMVKAVQGAVRNMLCFTKMLRSMLRTGRQNQKSFGQPMKRLKICSNLLSNRGLRKDLCWDKSSRLENTIFSLLLSPCKHVSAGSALQDHTPAASQQREKRVIALSVWFCST